MIIDLIVGCRPNFVKAAAIIEASKKYMASDYSRITVRLIHTGQHSDSMSEAMHELGLDPQVRFRSIWTNKHASYRLGYMASELAEMWDRTRWEGNAPDYVMVVGDTDSTLAGAIAAKKCGLKLIHVEAGLRCGVATMQEEINRKMIDSVSDILYTSTKSATQNLLDEGHKRWNVVFVGNVMVDTLFSRIAEARAKYSKPMSKYAMLTLHRAENVDSGEMFEGIMDAVDEVSANIPVIFPKHPRSRDINLAPFSQVKIVPPMGYLEFISTLSQAQFVMTDSGGVQEETTALGVPCVTIRPNTERPETVHQGTNVIAGTDGSSIVLCARDANRRWYNPDRTPMPELWDGHAADRIIQDLLVRHDAA